MLEAPRQTYVNLAAMLQNNLCMQNNFELKPLSRAREANHILHTGSDLLQNNFEKSWGYRYVRSMLEACVANNSLLLFKALSS